MINCENSFSFIETNHFYNVEIYTFLIKPTIMGDY